VASRGRKKRGVEKTNREKRGGANHPGKGKRRGGEVPPASPGKEKKGRKIEGKGEDYLSNPWREEGKGKSHPYKRKKGGEKVSRYAKRGGKRGGELLLRGRGKKGGCFITSTWKGEGRGKDRFRREDRGRGQSSLPQSSWKGERKGLFCNQKEGKKRQKKGSKGRESDLVFVSSI